MKKNWQTWRISICLKSAAECEEVLNPPPAAVTKTFIFINDSPCTLLFFVGYVFFQVAFVLVSQLRSSHSSGLSQILTGHIITTTFSPTRGRYKRYADFRLSTGPWSFVRIWLLFIDFSIYI